MPTPSLILVPARFKTGKLYTPVATTSGGTVLGASGDFNVTRATAATRVNASGLIESVASGIPRLDYYTSGGTAGCPALLVEPSGTNLVPSGTTFNLSTGINYANVSSSPAVGISGTVISKTNAVTGTQYANQVCLTALPSGSTNYTISRFFKYNGTDITTSLELNNGAQWGNTSWRQPINITSGGVTIGTSLFCTGSVENYGDGWYRVIVRLTTGASPTGVATVSYLMAVPGAVASGGSFLTALPQLEVGSVATSYIPTTTGSVSRNADVISVSGAVSGSIGSTEGTIYAEVDTTSQTAVRTLLTLSDGTATNRIRFRLTTATNLEMERSVSGSTNATLNVAVPASGIYKVALGYNASASGFVIYVNGSSVGTIAAATPTFTNQLTRIDIGSNIGASPLFNDRIRAVALYTTKLTNAELAALTT